MDLSRNAGGQIAGTSAESGPGARNLEILSEERLLNAFNAIPSVEKAWTCTTRRDGRSLDVVVAMSQINVVANSRRTFISSLYIPDALVNPTDHHWSPFPFEVIGASLFLPSPTGSKLLIVRNMNGGVKDASSAIKLEIWGSGQLLKEIFVPDSVHGCLYADGWFEGVSWNHNEDSIAYVAEESPQPHPVFGRSKSEPMCSGNSSKESNVGIWNGQGDWKEDWGEYYTGRRRPIIFVASLKRQACRAAKLTGELTSALSPCFSPAGNSLVFLSSKAAVESGVHCATISLHFLQWPAHGPFGVQNLQVRDVVPVVSRPEEGCFPGLYCANLIAHPWLSDGTTLLISSSWRSTQVILAVNVESGKVTRITPLNSRSSWSLLAVQDNYVIAAVSSPNAPPSLKLGHNPKGVKRLDISKAWIWTDISVPYVRYAERVEASLASSSFEILQIPIPTAVPAISQGAREPFEAILVFAKPLRKVVSQGGEGPAPLILALHGGPHSVSQTTFSRTAAFLCALGFNLLHVNYRGSLGFGEESLQSLPGNVGSQDVGDVLAALDQVIAEGLADPNKVAVLGGSHGGFLASHLVGQAPERFQTAALRNPVCNLSSMVGTTDIPDWCFVELYGKNGMQIYTEAPTDNDVTRFYLSSPLAHILKVKVPTLFLLGAEDRRVPISNGLQYVRALRQRGLEVKVIVFPKDIHPIDRPQSEFESFVNIGAWFKRHL